MSLVPHAEASTGPIGLPGMVAEEVSGVFFRERGLLGGRVAGSVDGDGQCFDADVRIETSASKH